MRKILGFLFTIFLSIGSFVYPMKNEEALKPILSKIEQLQKNDDQKSKKTLKVLGSIFYYIECLCEIVNAEKIAAKKELDVTSFDDEVEALVDSLNELFNELDEEDRYLLDKLDSLFGNIDSNFNFRNIMTFIEARRVFAEREFSSMKSFIDLICFVKTLEEEALKDSFFNDITKTFRDYYTNVTFIKDYKILSTYRTKFIDISKFTQPVIDSLLERTQKIENVHTSILKKESCAICKKLHKKMGRCFKCKIVYYCSVKCQKEHWEYHKKVCKKLKTSYNKYQQLKNLVHGAFVESNKFKQIYNLMVNQHKKISTEFVTWYENAKSFKCVFSTIYKKIYACLEDKKILRSYQNKTLPSSIFFINDLICKRNLKTLRPALRALTIISDYCDEVFGYSYKNSPVTIQAIPKFLKRISMLLKSQMVKDNKFLYFQLARLVFFDIWTSEKNTFTECINDLFDTGQVFVSPKIFIAPTFKYYKALINKKIKEIEGELKKPKKKRGKKTRRKKAKKSKTYDSKKKSQYHKPVVENLQEDECDDSSDPGSSEENVIGYDTKDEENEQEVQGVVDYSEVSRATQELRNGLFGDRDISIKVSNGDIGIRQVWGPFDADSMSCVLYKDYENKHNKKNLELIPVRGNLYTCQDKFHGFSYMVDEFVKKGYGKLITKTDDLPECCKSYGQLKLEISGRFAIIIKGKLATTKIYFYKVQNQNKVNPSDNGFVRENGRKYEVFNGYFMYVFGKDGKLIHRCFHKER